MARSSTLDPVEKFRFRLTILSVDLSLTALADLVGTLGDNAFGVFTRLGFSEVDIPKVNVKTITYRENIDNPRFLKTPGLVSYDPISLKRGVTTNRDMYEWYRLVNEELALLATAGELTREARLTPAQTQRFRKDVVIEVLDRTGEPVKGWFLFNAFPIGYKGGDTLNADTQEKLVEELNLDFEFFLEFEGGAEGFAKELAKDSIITAAGAAASAFDVSRDRGLLK